MQYIAFSVGKTTHLYVLAYKNEVCRIIICKSIGARDIPDLNRCLSKRPTLGRCSYVSRGRYCLWSRMDSNHGHPDYESGALTNWATGPVDFLNDVEKSNSISYTMRTTWAHWSYEKCVVFYDPLASGAVASGPDSNRISNQYLMDSGPSLITPTWLLRFVASLYLHR